MLIGVASTEASTQTSMEKTFMDGNFHYFRGNRSRPKLPRKLPWKLSMETTSMEVSTEISIDTSTQASTGNFRGSFHGDGSAEVFMEASTLPRFHGSFHRFHGCFRASMEASTASMEASINFYEKNK